MGSDEGAKSGSLTERTDLNLNDKDFRKVCVLVVGGGPAGLAAAIELKCLRPETDVCVVEKAAGAGNHNLSGAVLEQGALERLLDKALPGWQDSNEARQLLGRRVRRDDILFLPGRRLSFKILFALKLARKLGLAPGQMRHEGDYILSVSKLTKWLGQIAETLGVDVLTGFAAAEILLDESARTARGVKLVDQGRDKQGRQQPNFVAGEVIQADFVVLAEGCDGLLTEQFIDRAGLTRASHQLYSLGVKELIKVSREQYERFGTERVVHALGYPIWTPVIGPAMFGGGIMYPGEQDHISVGMIVGADWKYCDFNPQDALVNFKEHRFVRQFIDGGTVVEAGAKMIPEGGYYAIARDPATGSIGKGNVLIVGDGAGFVNMLKIKGLHNAIETGMQAAQAIAESLEQPAAAAQRYTALAETDGVMAEMASARHFRQAVAKFGPLQGMALSVFGGLLPQFSVEKDREAMTAAHYRLKGNREFDKDTFTARAATGHREDQPSHLSILDSDICSSECMQRFGRPCITFCPAGVYETVGGQVKPANPSNCLHCKTCQQKCPFDNVRWTVPEGGGGPRYSRM